MRAQRAAKKGELEERLAAARAGVLQAVAELFAKDWEFVIDNFISKLPARGA